MSHRAFCGISAQHLGELIAELATGWDARCESDRYKRRRGARSRKAGAGPKYDLVFTDRVLVTLVRLRTGPTHEALGAIYDVGSSMIGRAIHEIRPLPATRGFAVPDRPGLRLRTLEDVFACAAAENVTLRIDGTETQVRRPQAHCPGRRAFVSGRRRQNTIKSIAGQAVRLVPQQGGAPYRSRIGPCQCLVTGSEGADQGIRRRPAGGGRATAGPPGLLVELPFGDVQ
ncbi:transposase family protein [Streptomyces sp. NBC_00876]|uniref:helix-turn-helix domain-containing protein n=1 Tax=Streptomyces sp. NBC_00876 TaxID=2975853 RepID=UPI0038703E60|nr:transposase family protein [Streptomyces sp. NBC_00876]